MMSVCERHWSGVAWIDDWVPLGGMSTAKFVRAVVMRVLSNSKDFGDKPRWDCVLYCAIWREACSEVTSWLSLDPDPNLPRDWPLGSIYMVSHCFFNTWERGWYCLTYSSRVCLSWTVKGLLLSGKMHSLRMTGYLRPILVASVPVLVSCWTAPFGDPADYSYIPIPIPSNLLYREASYCFKYTTVGYSSKNFLFTSKVCG